MNLRTIDPISDARWDSFVSARKDSSIYHHSSWARVLKEAYDYNPQYYVLEDERGEIIAGVPFIRIKSWLTGNRLVCLPFSDSCWPLANNAQEMKLLLAPANDDVECHRISHFEIRGWIGSSLPQDLGLVSHPYYVFHTANLDKDLEKLRAKLHQRARRGLKESEKRGITVSESTDEAGMEEFYRLHVHTRRKHRVLPQPYRFFKAIFRHIVIPGHGFLMLAEYQGRPVAGVLYLVFGNTITYKFNASDQEYLHSRPNHPLVWKAMERACLEGYTRFDFGRSAPENLGLLTFKGQWATEDKVVPYYYYPSIGGVVSIPESSLKWKAMASAVKIMPDLIFKSAGAFLYRHIG